MPEVGIRELKKHLSEYLDRASKGELIQVTDRGYPKATLGPLPVEARIQQGIREGWITPPARPRAPVPHERRYRPLRSLQEVLDEDREE